MRRLMVNFTGRLKFGLRNPIYTLQSLGRELLSSDEKFLSVATGRPVKEIANYLEEPFRDARFFAHLQQSDRALRKAGVATSSADFYGKRVVLQYAVVRATKPDVVLETGIANGVSASYLLLALENNRRGKLHTVGLDDPEFLPPGEAVGWVVPAWLRERWTMYIGDARELLAPLAQQLAPLDIFIHDSLHTYDHMKFEFAETFPYLRAGGVLIADDASWNPAFSEFANRVGAPAARIVRGVGVMRKGGL